MPNRDSFRNILNQALLSGPALIRGGVLIRTITKFSRVSAKLGLVGRGPLKQQQRRYQMPAEVHVRKRGVGQRLRASTAPYLCIFNLRRPSKYILLTRRLLAMIPDLYQIPEEAFSYLVDILIDGLRYQE